MALSTSTHRNAIDVAPREHGSMDAIPSTDDAGGDVAELGRELATFNGLVVQHLKQKKDDCESAREGERNDWTKRYDRNERRVNVLPNVLLDDEGQISSASLDPHAEVGLCMGWSSQGTRNVAANLRRRVLREPNRSI